MRKIALGVLILTGSAFAQTGTAPHGSISGTVTEADTGLPLPGRMVSISLGSAQSVATDFHGHYKLPDLPPGHYTLQVKGDDLVQEAAPVNLAAGQDLTSLDLAVMLFGSISGRVTDQDERPVAGAWVLLLTKTYQNGKLRYGQTSFATTDRQGRYKLNGVIPGRGYAVMTKAVPRGIQAISPAPEDPAKREPALTPTYYPNSTFAESAQTVMLHSGQNLEDVDIRAERGPSYCVEGVMEAGGEPAALDFEINDSLTVNNGDGINGGLTLFPTRGTTGPDGKFRICDLHPGGYRLTVTQGRLRFLNPVDVFYADVPILVEDRDMTRLQVSAIAGLGLSGEVVWDGDGPAQATDTKIDAKIRIVLQTLDRGPMPGSAESSAPGRFHFDNLVLGEYIVRVSGVPAGSYVKDVTYGGVSVWHAGLRFGSAAGNAGMKVVLARDGSAISARVADKDGNFVPSASVWIVPANVQTAAEWAAIVVPAKTDATGVSNSGTLPPGKYTVFATKVPFERTAANIDRLWGSHLRGQDVDIPPGGTAQVSLEPIAIF